MPGSGSARRRLAVVAVAALTLAGVNIVAARAADTAGDTASRHALPMNDTARGLVYDGLQRRPTGPCGPNLLEVKGTSPVMCTHGPDAAPAGLSVKTAVPPLA